MHTPQNHINDLDDLYKKISKENIVNLNELEAAQSLKESSVIYKEYKKFNGLVILQEENVDNNLVNMGAILEELKGNVICAGSLCQVLDPSQHECGL